MSRSYPIWNEVQACHYNSGKSYGNKETGSVNVYVGSSSSNSNHFLEHIVTKREHWVEFLNEDCIVFSFSVDGVILKKMYFKNNNGRAGKLLKTKTKLNRIKSL